MTNWVKEVKECDTSNLFRRLRERVRSDCIERNQDLGDEFVKFENDATRQFNVVACKGDGRIQFIHSGKRILVRDGKDRDILYACPVINKFNECMYEVGNEQLHAWQLSKRVLFGLFFPDNM